MNLDPRIILVGLLGGAGLVCSCSQDTGSPDAAADHLPLFSRTSFDGCWNWYEGGKQAYSVAILNGEVLSFRPMSRHSTRNNDSTANCAIDAHDGLVVISSANRDPGDRWATVTTLRFDLSDTSGGSCLDGLRAGVIAGRRTVEHNDPDDHFLFPPHEHKRGLLVRCN